MTIGEAIKSGLIGAYTMVVVYDIRSDAYLTYPVKARDLSSEYYDYDIVHVDPELRSPKEGNVILCLDVRR